MLAPRLPKYILKKGQYQEIVDESVSPKPLRIHFGRFMFCLKFAEIFTAQDAPPVSLSPVANGKKLQSEKF
jgi:hypothetical protein